MFWCFEIDPNSLGGLGTIQTLSFAVLRASFNDYSLKNWFLKVFLEIPEFAVFLRDIFAHYFTRREVNTSSSNALKELIFAGTNFRVFRGFSAKSRKFEPTKIFASSKPLNPSLPKY